MRDGANRVGDIPGGALAVSGRSVGGGAEACSVDCKARANWNSTSL